MAHEHGYEIKARAEVLTKDVLQNLRAMVELTQWMVEDGKRCTPTGEASRIESQRKSKSA